MSTLVIGGTGFIGTRLVRKLVARGDKVICFDLIPNAERLTGLDVRVLQGDMTCFEDLLDTVREHKVDRIVALAYLMPPMCEQKPLQSVRHNLLGIANVFEVARVAGVARTVFASSGAACGGQDQFGDNSVTEQSFGQPQGLYGNMKQFNEKLAQRYRELYKTIIVTVRIAVPMAHGRIVAGGGSWTSDLVSLPALGQPVTVPFHPESKTNVLYLDDLAELFAKVTLAQQLQRTLYHGSANICTLRQIGEAVRGFIPDARVSFNEKGMRWDKLAPYLMDNSASVNELEWHPRSLTDQVLTHINEARAANGLALLAR
jgi:nucleoside-diphosphate-sugar epimerase